MSPLLVLACIYLPLFALTAWFNKRLRDAVAERHLDAFRSISSLTRLVPRSRRGLERVTRYKMLQDRVVNRHIRDLGLVESILGYAVLAFFAFVLVMMAVSAIQR